MNRDTAIEWGRRLNRASLYSQVLEAREDPAYWLAANPSRGYYLSWCGPLPRRSEWDLMSWDPVAVFGQQAKSLQ